MKEEIILETKRLYLRKFIPEEKMERKLFFILSREEGTPGQEGSEVPIVEI